MVRFLIPALLLLNASCAEKPVPDFTDKWNAFETRLIRQTKSFQASEPFDTVKGDIRLVTFPSDSLLLQGLLNTHHIDPESKKPVLVFLHGGFALSYAQMELLQPFTDAGFIAFAPTYRGENGNPGYFELFLGEVRDTKAAIRWLAQQSYTDRENIYVFGWSVGGGIALSLSLHDDIPIKASGSSAGIYDRDLIKAWATEDDLIVFPYDYRNERENYFRLPLYTLKSMVRPHTTYIGKEDGYAFARNLIDSLYPDDPLLLKLIEVEGDHRTSLQYAMQAFIRDIQTQGGNN